MNVPKLRFKEFNDEWSFIELSKISSDISYGMGLASKEYDGENKYIRITDIDETTNKYLNKDVVSPDGELEDKYLVNKNDILFARTGASTGKTYLYDENDGKLYFAGFLIRATIINHDSNFIFQQTKTNRYNKWVKIMSMRSGQPGINSQQYGSYKFSIASSEEEKKISKTLNLLDKKIELQTKKIEDLKLFKKGLNDSIIFRKTGMNIEISTLITEYNKKTTINNQYPVLSSTMNGITIQQDYFNKSASSSDTTGYKIIPKDYITYRSMSDTGQFYFNLQNIIDIGIVSPAYPVFKLNSDVNLEYFLNYINNCKEFKNQILSIKEGGTRFALSFNKFSQLFINIPEEKYMNLFGKTLTIINKKLQFEITKLNKLQQLKKGLMQSMFV